MASTYATYAKLEYVITRTINDENRMCMIRILELSDCCVTILGNLFTTLFCSH